MLKRGESSGVSERPNCRATSSGVAVSVKRPHIASRDPPGRRGYRAPAAGGSRRRGNSAIGFPLRGQPRAAARVQSAQQAAGSPREIRPPPAHHDARTLLAAFPLGGPPPRYDRMPNFRSHAVALIAASTLAPGCVYYGTQSRDVDRTPIVDTGVGATILMPGQSAPSFPARRRRARRLRGRRFRVPLRRRKLRIVLGDARWRRRPHDDRRNPRRRGHAHQQPRGADLAQVSDAALRPGGGALRRRGGRDPGRASSRGPRSRASIRRGRSPPRSRPRRATTIACSTGSSASSISARHRPLRPDPARRRRAPARQRRALDRGRARVAAARARRRGGAARRPARSAGAPDRARARSRLPTRTPTASSIATKMDASISGSTARRARSCAASSTRTSTADPTRRSSTTARPIT